MLALADVRAAATAIAPYVHRTPLRSAFQLGQRAGLALSLKLECWQHTGSFKLRGALNVLAGLTPAERASGIVTASAGNHALGVAFAARALGVSPVTIYVPRSAPRAKLDKLREFAIGFRVHGNDYDAAHAEAERFRADTGAFYVHAYDDPRTAAGQGTVALEMLEDEPELDVLVVPVGGGGMLAGLLVAAKALKPSIRVVGVQPEASPALRDSLRDGRCYEEYAALPTLCDGLSGGLGQLAFEVAQRLLDDVVVVSEAETRGAIRALLETQQYVVEASGAVGVAAILAGRVPAPGRRVAAVLSGGNIDLEVLAGILRTTA